MAGNLAVVRTEYEPPSMLAAKATDMADALRLNIEQRTNAGEEGVRNAVAKALRISAATLSQYLSGKYPGNVAGIDTTVRSYLTELDAQVQYINAKNVGGIVMTSQVEQALGTIDFAVRHKGFALLIGEAGCGKSSAMKYYAEQHSESAIYVDLQQEDGSPRGVMMAIFRACDRLRKCVPDWDDALGMTKMDSTSLKHLAINFFKGGREVLLIDEANNLIRAGMESVRTLQQAASIPVVLSGTYELDAALGFRRGRKVPNDAMHRRILMRSDLEPQISRDNVAAIVGRYSRPTEGVVEWLYQRCNVPGRRYGYLDTILSEARFALQQSGHGEADITTDDLKVVERILLGK